MRYRQFAPLATLVVLLSACPQAVWAQNGKLVVHVVPRETYIYADGTPIADAKGHYVCLSPGEHKIDLYNYGFKPESRTVTIAPHKTTVLDVTMQAMGGPVSGPWACITLLNAPRGAILLNGKDPAAFLVGNGDEFDHETLWKQELIVPPGKHEIMVQCNCQNPWSTTVEVQANQRVIIDAYKGVRTTEAWSRGSKLGEQPRFRATWISSQVAVEKVGGQFAVNTNSIKCGESAQLNWSSNGATKTEINDSPVGASGNQTVQPTQTTQYKYVAAGPGGVFVSDATVNVDGSIPATLSVSPGEVRFSGEGPQKATVTWSAPNATSVTIDPVGSVGATGSQDVSVTPKTKQGAVDENVTYTLHATNACGASETRTATLHLAGTTGVMQGADATTLETKINFDSIYFPTAKPTSANPEGGLVASQEGRLSENANDLKQYMQLRPDAKLILEAHTDVRGGAAYNQRLSERRAERVKAYLVSLGIPADRIETKGYGKTKNLTRQEVASLTAENPDVTPEARQKMKYNVVIFLWANNRRVDIMLSPVGKASKRYYPFNAADVDVLLGRGSAVRQAATKK